MPYRVKVYLIFWIIGIIGFLLVRSSKKLYSYVRWRQQTGKKMMILRYHVYSWLHGDMPEESPKFDWSFKNIISSLFTLIIVFFIGLIIVYYNFFGLGDVVFGCKKHDIDCKINAIEKGMKEGYSKPSKSTSKSTSQKNTTTRKVVKKNKR